MPFPHFSATLAVRYEMTVAPVTVIQDDSPTLPSHSRTVVSRNVNRQSHSLRDRQPSLFMMYLITGVAAWVRRPVVYQPVYLALDTV